MYSEVLLCVNDDGMALDRIMAGDQVSIIEEILNEKDIFAVLHNSQVMMRRIFKKIDGFVLVPSNKEYPIIKTCELHVLGKVSHHYIKY